MIIVDFSQVIISNMMGALGNHKDTKVELKQFRHMVLNTIRSINKKFRDEYGELIIATDDGAYWRKNIFPYYKAKRKEKQNESDVDWKMIFDYLKTIRQEIKETFKYRVIQVPHAEADDIIATLCGLSSKTLIVSRDKDFIQLHNDIVKQYDPISESFISHPSPALYKKKHIIKGDNGDGIPNILSPDDCFVTKQRQKPVTKQRLDMWLNMNKEEICQNNKDMLRRYERNKTLIDLDMIPEEIKTQILAQYHAEEGKSNKELLAYLVKNRLKNLAENIRDFS